MTLLRCLRRSGWLALYVLLGCSRADAQTDATVRYKLPNGLHVILRPIQGASQAAVVTLFSIGGDQDPQGASGLAHLVEHLYTTAAAGDVPERTAEEFFRAYPAGCNAQTGDDYTVFATVAPSTDLEKEIKHHAARMGDLRITDADLKRELPRIEAELANMYGRIPALGAPNLARQQVRPAPLGGRKEGLIEQLKTVKLEPVQQRWTDYYKPANATLVVAGAFKVADAKQWIKDNFGSLPAGKPAPAAQPPGAPQNKSAQTVDIKPIQPGAHSTGSLTFAAPSPNFPDFAPFIVLVGRLMVQNPQTAFNFAGPNPGVRFAPLDDPNVLSIVAELKPDETLPQLETRLRDAIGKATNAPFSATDSAQARQLFAFILAADSLPDAAISQNVYGVAFSLGRLSQFGIDAAALQRKLEQVTAADIQRVAQKYLSAEQGAVVLVRAK